MNCIKCKIFKYNVMVIVLKKLYWFLMKSLLCMVLFLILAILCKKNNQYKYFIQEKIYQDHFSFASFENFYNQYLGGIFPIENILRKDTSSVFREKIVSENISAYLDGAKLVVGEHYLIPIMEDGIVVYIGEKEEYGNVVMIENAKGIDVWYGNVCNVMVKLYDQVKAGNYVGESCSSEIYLVYTKGKKVLNYKDFL